jgi:hypothetical protein
MFYCFVLPLQLPPMPLPDVYVIQADQPVGWIGQNAAAIQAISAVVQGILTIVTIWFAIHLAKQQRQHERSLDEAERLNERALAKEKESSILKHTRIALREEVLMMSNACLRATDLWLHSNDAITIRSLIFPPLTVFEANASLIGQLDRNEIIGLVAFSASLADLRIIAHHIEERRLAMAGIIPGPHKLTPQDIESITGLLRTACFGAANFLEANPERPEEPQLKEGYLIAINQLRAIGERTLLPADATRH